MSCSLCCGTLNVSQLTIPALPTSEIERLGHDDSTSAEDSEYNQSSEDPSSLSALCDHDLEDRDSATEKESQGSPGSPAKDSLCEEKPVVRKKVKSYTSRKKMEKDLSKKKTKFWTFKLKRRSLSSGGGTRMDQSPPKPFVTPDYPDEPTISEPFGASSVSSSTATSSPLPQVLSTSRRTTMGAGPGPSSLAAELRQVVPPPTPQPHLPSLFQMVPVTQRGDVPQAVAMPMTMPSNLSLAGRLNQDEINEDQARIAQRTKDIELGIEIGRAHHHSAYPHFQYPSARNSLSTSSSSTSDSLWSLSCSFQNQCSTAAPRYPPPEIQQQQQGISLTTFGHGRAMDAAPPSCGSVQQHVIGGLPPPGPCIPRTEYTQVDYIHCLVPDLHGIANCSFYWGVMDRYEAESLLDNRPEGTFLLRDSAQDDFLFSVSFRRYSRSLHARIDQWNHKFSFDTHDPGVFSADTVTSLIEHYKDPNCCMFFEPMLTRPLCRNFPFSLQHLCRSVICGMSTYDGVNCLPLPKSLVEYLKYYHYKQKVRVRKFQVTTKQLS